MEKWNHIQKQPLLRQIFKEPPNHFLQERKIPKRHARQSKLIEGLHMVSQRYGCAACQLCVFLVLP